MNRVLMSILLAITLPSMAAAQSTAFDRMTPPLPTHGERVAADVASYATLATVMALDFKASWEDRNNRAHAVQMFAVRAFVTWGWAEIAKGLAARTRPDGSDAKSFYSQHTAHAFSTLGGPRVSFAIPLAVGTGGLRIAASKHYLTDVLVGAGVGALTSRIR